MSWGEHDPHDQDPFIILMAIVFVAVCIVLGGGFA